MPVWETFHFIRPWSLLLIPVLLPLVYLLRWHMRQQSGWQSVIPSHLLQKITLSSPGRQHAPPFWLATLAILIAAIALAGPTWEKLPQPVYKMQQGRVMVMDMSLSMRATDLSPDRLTRARFKVIDLVSALTEGETGVIAYAGDAFTISPLTSDSKNILNLLPSVSPEIMPVPGSDPLLGLQQASSLLRNAGYQQGDIVWVTDDVSQSQYLEISRFMAEQPYHFHVLAVGTEEGAPIRQTNGELLKAADGNIVIPRLREAPLRSLAKTGGGVFTRLRMDDKDIDALLSALQTPLDTPADAQEKQLVGDSWQDMGAYLCLLLLPLALYAFRRGVLLSVLLLPLLVSLPRPAQAQSPETALPWWQRPFLNADQQGSHYFAQQDYLQAQQHFRSPEWSASAAYRAGDYAAAAELFAQLEGAQARYNEGNALAHLGEFDAAIAAYSEALALQPDFAEAQHNKALLEQLQQEQEQQQQEQQEQQQSPQDQPSSDDNENSDASSANDQQQDPSEGDDEQDSDTSGSDEQGDQQQDDSQSQDQSDDASGTDDAEQTPEDTANAEQGTEAEQPQPAALTDEEREEQERLQNLLKRVPDDPAFLLKRKMQLEAQKRQRQAAPPDRTTW